MIRRVIDLATLSNDNSFPTWAANAWNGVDILTIISRSPAGQPPFTISEDRSIVAIRKRLAPVNPIQSALKLLAS
jgi:hypothetical protein